MYATNGTLPDIQKSIDNRGTAIDQVGVSNVRYPVSVMTRDNGPQHTVATVAMSVNLPAHVKGTHMSRFIEVLSAYQGSFSSERLPEVTQQVRERLGAERARIEIAFPYFISRPAPVTGKAALTDYDCWLRADVSADTEEIVIGLKVPVASLCPCSKEISDYGAHNQRGDIDVQIKLMRDADGTTPMLWFEEIIDMAEASGSAPLYPLLKRPDERYVTMQAYDNPAFVEDIIRNLAVRLKGDARIAWFQIQVTNYESIHHHNAFAQVAWQRANPVD